MFGLGIPELIVILVILALLAVPVWLWGRIAHKAGFSKGWGFAAIIPVANLVVLWVFAFAAWPGVDGLSSTPSTPRGTG